jgi:hypothetical protein
MTKISVPRGTVGSIFFDRCKLVCKIFSGVSANSGEMKM